MGRFTREQSIMGELMGRLIDIYYMEDIFDSSDELVLKRLLKFIKKLPVNNDSIYEELKQRRGMYSLFPYLEIDFDELNTFRFIMETLHSAIIKEEYELFYLHSVEDDVQTVFREYIRPPIVLRDRKEDEEDDDEVGKRILSIPINLHTEINKGAIS